MNKNTITRTNEFSDWLSRLKDLQARAAVIVRIKRAEQGNFGDHKDLGDGVSEMRVDVGPGYRVYYAREGRVVYLLLSGGDKSSQTSDIRRAKELWASFKKEQS
ncbi:type II toxin-antitoxin system RelE/ParE family toxin [Caballeronia humi]|uniref:Addiction module killer protein n=1 Tax=Caballeronia humi TaxID=326474 RepID=A0A158JJA3_9BURK|nr:type II toxin-antitoxin system RelE/ParE family toxin [Caballeronia humi]SAL68914.1 putative addiction module killer protein [Caballeronia humi]